MVFTKKGKEYTLAIFMSHVVLYKLEKYSWLTSG